MLVRRAAGVTSVSEACSIGRNGPTSLPDGLSTPERRGHQEHEEPGAPGEDRAGRGHQQGADDERSPTPDPIGVGRQPQADQRVADERQREEDADLPGVEPDRGEVQDEDEAEGAVAGHPDRPREEQQPGVPGHGASVGWPPWPNTRIPMPPKR